MAASGGAPLSKILQTTKSTEPDGDVDADGSRRHCRDEYRKLKELEEGRKAGTVPAMTDVETGADINPHIPNYISEAPWYVDASGPTLRHQKPHPEREKKYSAIDEWYERGHSTKRVTKYRAGACENCGSMTHKKKDCLERPRKIGAKFTGEDIAPDDQAQPQLNFSYDAKRDRWNGYDPSEHKKIIEEYELLEEARKVTKAAQIEDSATEVGKETVEDEDKYAEFADMPGVKLDVDSRTRITVRNLRIREDTAKYLYNLDPNSAYYDPKSRAMRQNPFQGKDDSEAPFAGDNFMRYTGEVITANEAQIFAWEAQKRGVDVHSLAEPTKLEALKSEFSSRTDRFKSTQQRTIVERYGGEEHLEAPPKELLLAQSEVYVEYNRKGKLIKGEERPVPRSRYEEDVFINNHTSVWGSYWKNGQWSYKCCHSTIKNSICTGEAGKDAHDDVEATVRAQKLWQSKPEPQESSKKSSNSDGDESSSSSSSTESSSSESESESKQAKKAASDIRAKKRREKRQKRKAAAKKKQRSRSDKKSKDESSDSEDEDETEKSKRELRAALIKQEMEEREGEKLRRMDDRKRKFNSNYEEKQLTDADMEAYKLRRVHTDDPMAEYLVPKR